MNRRLTALKALARRRYNQQQARDAHGRWSTSGGGKVMDAPGSSTKHVIVAKMGDYVTLRHDDLPGGMAYQTGATAAQWHKHLQSKYGLSEDGMIRMDGHEVEAFAKGHEPPGVTAATTITSKREVVATLKTKSRRKQGSATSQAATAKPTTAPPEPDQPKADTDAPHEALIARGKAAMPAKLDARVKAYAQAEKAHDDFSDECDRGNPAERKKLDRLNQEWQTAHNQLASAFKGVLDDLQKRSPFTDDMTQYLSVEPKLEAAWGSSAVHHKEAINNFYRLTGGVGTETLQAGMRFEDGRAHACPLRRCVFLSGSEAVTSTIHELAHHIEFSSQVIKGAKGEALQPIAAAAASFIRSRATGAPQPLSKLTGTKYYDDSEVAYPDRFLTPYVGKLYADLTDSKRGIDLKATEVISMGFEHFTRPDRMAHLYAKDPDHFHLMVGIIHTLQDATREHGE